MALRAFVDSGPHPGAQTGDLERFRDFLREGAPGPHAYVVLLGLDAFNPPALFRALTKGLPYRAFERFVRNSQLPANRVMALIDVPRRTLTRRKRDGRFLPSESGIASSAPHGSSPRRWPSSKAIPLRRRIGSRRRNARLGPRRHSISREPRSAREKSSGSSDASSTASFPDRPRTTCAAPRTRLRGSRRGASSKPGTWATPSTAKAHGRTAAAGLHLACRWFTWRKAPRWRHSSCSCTSDEGRRCRPTCSSPARFQATSSRRWIRHACLRAGARSRLLPICNCSEMNGSPARHRRY